MPPFVSEKITRHFNPKKDIEQDGGAEAFKEIFQGYLDVANKAKFAEKTKIPRRNFYRMVPEGNLTLDTIARVMQPLCGRGYKADAFTPALQSIDQCFWPPSKQ